MSHSPSSVSHGVDGLGRSAAILERFAPFGIGLGLFLLPLLFPLGMGRDYPNHLARVYIQSRLASEPDLAANYTLEWFLVPDLALDLFALPLAAWLSPYVVGGLFNGLMLLLLFTAALALHRQGGRDGGTLWPLLATALLFNEALRWGFVNFLFACGMALWILYFWLASDHWPRGRRLVVFSLAQFVLFFVHLLGFMLCGYLILTLELVRFWQAGGVPLRQRCADFVVRMLQFAVPLLLFGYVLLGQSGVGDDRTVYGDLGGKALAFLSPTSALASPFSFLLLLVILLRLYGILRDRQAVIDRRLLPLLFAMLGLIVVMPSMVLGIWGLDFRYPFVALMLLVSAVRLGPALAASAKLKFAVFAAALVALGGAGLQFADTDRKLQPLREALQLAEPGGALLVAGEFNPACPVCFPPWIDQLQAGSLAAIERQMFVPLLFTATSLVAPSPTRHDLDVPHGLPVSRQMLIDGRHQALMARGPAHNPAHPYWFSWDDNFDNLLWLRSSAADLDGIPGLQRLASGEVFVLYRILRPLEDDAFPLPDPARVQ